ncbi:MAG: PEGA domain-containing protein [Bdellovibrionota bacterium]
MNKLFYFLLFCSVAGAGVLWWLIQSTGEKAPHAVTTVEAPKGLVIDDRPSIPKDAHVSDATEHAETPAAAKVEEKSPPRGDAKATVLSISSEPEGVSVFIDGKQVAKTPVERSLTNKVQKFRFEKEGFVPVERDAPAESKPEGAYMSWRISMVTQQIPATKKAVIGEDGDFFLKGVSGPVFVQIKALSSALETRPAIIKQVQDMRKKLREERIVICEVSLGKKGNWSRILAGPFPTRDDAHKSLGFLKEGLKADDLFVTGEQSCL